MTENTGNENRPQQQPNKPVTPVTPSSKPKKKNNQVILIAFIAILLIVNAVQFVLNKKSIDQKDVAISEQEVQIDDMIQRIDSISIQLDEKIVMIEQLGGDVEELKRVKAELESEKAELKKSSNVAWASYKKVKGKVDGYETLLKQKDEEIAKLQAQNEELYSENTGLKTEKNQLNDSISSLSAEAKKLQSKVAIASRLKAENVTVVGVSDKGKERVGEFRDKQVENLKVSFNLAKNDVAPIGNRELFIRVIDENGSVLFDVARGSGSFMLNSREEFYTEKQEVLFDNSQQKVSFLYNKGGEYAEGNYTVEIYAQDYLIGTGAFVVK